MDPGLQLYGNKLFKTYKNLGDDIFRGLPAPQASRSKEEKLKEQGVVVKPIFVPQAQPKA
jgi:hypothetical protein